MKKYAIGLLAALILVLCMPAAAQDTSPESPVLHLLRFVPDTPNNRQWVSFGDMAAWHQSWDVPRIQSLDDLNNLTRDQRADWMSIAASQTYIPQAMGLNYLATDDLQGFYGFDIFTVDRFMLAGNPPDEITLVDFSFDKAHIADSLTASGYDSQPLGQDATLYSILDDYAVDMTGNMVTTRTGRLGGLNRIALLDNRLIIGRATDPVSSAVSAGQGEIPSLADDASYVAAVKSLDDSALADTGDLVGVIFLDRAQVDQQPVVPAESADQVNQMLQDYEAAPLPPYNLAAFATRHGNGATHLILEVVFPEGVDAESAATILADRMQNYTSLRTRQPLTDRWTFELSAGTEIGGLPTALVVMKVDDPPPTPAGQDTPRVNVFSWVQMISARDTLFLTAQP